MRDSFVPTAEAAFIAGISDRDMNRAVDEHILPEPLIRSGNGRRFARLGAALAGFYFTSEDVYTAPLRRKVVEEMTARLRVRADLCFRRCRFCRRWLFCDKGLEPYKSY